MSTEQTHLQARVDAFVRASGKSWRRIEREAGVGDGTIKAIMYGKFRNPSIKTLRGLAKIFGCTIEELTGSSDIGIPTSRGNGIALADTLPTGWQCPVCKTVWAPHIDRCGNEH